MQTELQGFLLINKPKDTTSFDCIRRIKKILAPTKTKIGHAGTLDPFATGLLIIALSRQATKHISLLMKLDKEYIATGKLGELTDTLDKTGKVSQSEKLGTVSEQQLQESLQALNTHYMQTPPAFAALKYQGKPLYVLARKKNLPDEKLAEILKQKKRKVHIYTLELLAYESPFFTIKAHVSHGTYIRSLVNDIAQQVGTFATTYELGRTRIGPFSLEEAQHLASLTSEEDIIKHLIAIPECIERVKKYKNL